MTATWHLAQLNVARSRAPLTSPEMASFVAELDRINRIADQSPGFVWRLQTEEGDATGIRVLDDPRIIVNLTVWESPEALHAYVYRSEHLEVLRKRREWFEPMETAHMVLWWIPAGNIPTVDQGIRRLLCLRESGPSPEAFTFRHAWPSPALVQP